MTTRRGFFAQLAGAALALAARPRTTSASSRLVEVIEAWHLPDGLQPGRHVIVVENYTR